MSRKYSELPYPLSPHIHSIPPSHQHQRGILVESDETSLKPLSIPSLHYRDGSKCSGFLSSQLENPWLFTFVYSLRFYNYLTSLHFCSSGTFEFPCSPLKKLYILCKNVLPLALVLVTELHYIPSLSVFKKESCKDYLFGYNFSVYFHIYIILKCLSEKTTNRLNNEAHLEGKLEFKVKQKDQQCYYYFAIRKKINTSINPVVQKHSSFMR